MKLGSDTKRFSSGPSHTLIIFPYFLTISSKVKIYCSGGFPKNKCALPMNGNAGGPGKLCARISLRTNLRRRKCVRIRVKKIIPNSTNILLILKIRTSEVRFYSTFSVISGAKKLLLSRKFLSYRLFSIQTIVSVSNMASIMNLNFITQFYVRKLVFIRIKG